MKLIAGAQNTCIAELTYEEAIMLTGESRDRIRGSLYNGGTIETDLTSLMKMVRKIHIGLQAGGIADIIQSLRYTADGLEYIGKSFKAANKVKESATNKDNA